MKIASWNVNSLRTRLPQVLSWLAEKEPDILALQETKSPDDRFPLEAIQEAGYQAAFCGQKTYNGVAILSRTEAGDLVTQLPDFHDPQKRLLAATIDDLRIINLYVPNGSEVGSEKYAYKLDWLRHAADFVQAEGKHHPKLAVVGDFNIAPEDRDVYDPLAWRERILCSTPERQALERLAGTGLIDTLRLFETEGGHYSWWDYRAGAFRRNQGLRIDLILVSAPLATCCISATIDVQARKAQRPSDHAPIIAEFDLSRSAP